MITNEKFEEEFEINTDEDIDMLVTFVEKQAVTNLKELKIKVSIAKHIECSGIHFRFSDNFKLEDIPD